MDIFVDTSDIIQNTMKETVVRIQINELATVGALTIANNGGGHEMSKTGEDDVIFTELTLSADHVETEKIIVRYPYKNGTGSQIVSYGGYEITVKSIEWNGEFVELIVTTK